MKKITLLTVLMSLIVMGLYAQNLEVVGKAKITIMDTATVSAQQVAREPDGTLSLMSSAPTTYAIGDFAHGGVVFWVSPSGEHGKVVSIYDVQSVPWSNIISTVIGLSAQSDINGAGNTVAIMMQSGHISSAARHCADLAYGGYDDWYLPSKNELNDVYLNRVAINTTALAHGGEAFASAFYWSSTEFNSNNAWAQDFGFGGQGASNKNLGYRVRAVRAF